MRGAGSGGAGEVVEVRASGRELGAVLGDGAAGAARWLWVLDGVEPLPGARDALLAAAAAHPEAALLQPKLLGPGGALVLPSHWPHYGRVRGVIDGAEHRVLPLRAADLRGVLLRADAVAAAGPPLRHGDPSWRPGWELTARLLRGAPGWLVPAAAVRLTAPLDPEPPELRFRNALWTAASTRAWTRRERFDRRVQALVGARREHVLAATLRAAARGPRPG